jgi:hypothetical protein
MGYITMPGEIRQEVLCPTPRGVRHPMHEQNGRETHGGYRIFFYDFQFHGWPTSCIYYQVVTPSRDPQYNLQTTASSRV